MRERDFRRTVPAHGRSSWALSAGDLLFYLVYSAIGLRFVLVLLHARPDAGFVRWVERVTDPLYAPFRDILPTFTVGDRFPVALSIAFAFVVYVMLHALLRALWRLTMGWPRSA